MRNNIDIVKEMRDFADSEVNRLVKQRKRLRPSKSVSLADKIAANELLLNLWLNRSQAYDYVLWSLRCGVSIHRTKPDAQGNPIWERKDD